MTDPRHCRNGRDELRAQATGRQRRHCDKPECQREAAARRQRKHRLNQRLDREQLIGRRPSQRRIAKQIADLDLDARAAELNARYLKGQATWRSIAFVKVPHGTVADCRARDGVIRLSEETRTFPSYVLEYVLIHELAHTVVKSAPGSHHPPRFWKLVGLYPNWVRAEGWLDGYYRRD